MLLAILVQHRSTPDVIEADASVVVISTYICLLITTNFNFSVKLVSMISHEMLRRT